MHIPGENLMETFEADKMHSGQGSPDFSLSKDPVSIRGRWTRMSVSDHVHAKVKDVVKIRARALYESRRPYALNFRRPCTSKGQCSFSQNDHILSVWGRQWEQYTFSQYLILNTYHIDLLRLGHGFWRVQVSVCRALITVHATQNYTGQFPWQLYDLCIKILNSFGLYLEYQPFYSESYKIKMI